MSKNLLKNLKNCIEDKERVLSNKVWFFDRIIIKGFDGTQNIVFIALNPSKGNVKFNKNRFPTKWDRKFYSLLIKHGFENAHITDFIKVKMKDKDLKDRVRNKKFLDRQLKYLLKELEIIKPKIIVAMGGKCQRLIEKYKKYFEDYHIFKMPHYSWRFDNGKIEKRFKELEKLYGK